MRSYREWVQFLFNVHISFSKSPSMLSAKLKVMAAEKTGSGGFWVEEARQKEGDGCVCPFTFSFS